MAEENEKKEEKNEKGDGKDKKPSSNLIVIVGIIAGVIILEAVILFFLLQATKPADPEKELAKAKADSLKTLESSQTSFGVIAEPGIEAIVNISGTDGSRFLKVVLKLEYDDAKYKTLVDDLALRNAKFKDMLLEQLSSMTLPEIQDSDAKNQIRKEFIRAVNTVLPIEVGQISNVYIDQFIVQ